MEDLHSKSLRLETTQSRSSTRFDSLQNIHSPWHFSVSQQVPAELKCSAANHSCSWGSEKTNCDVRKFAVTHLYKEQSTHLLNVDSTGQSVYKHSTTTIADSVGVRSKTYSRDFFDKNTESRQLSVTENQDLNSDVVECGFHFSIEIKQK